MQKVRKAVIPAAGFGTRFLPETKAIPKEMMPIVDTPALQLVVQEVVDSGIDNVLIITSGRKRSIEDHFDKSVELENLLKKAGKTAELAMCDRIENMANFTFIRQKEMKGSGQAIQLAREFAAGEPFAVLFGDDLMYSPNKPVTGQLIEAYEKTGTSILGVQAIDKKEVYKYGVINPGANKGRYTEVKGFVEKPPVEEAPSNLVSMGRYILTPEVFEQLDQSEYAPNGELYLTTAIERMIHTSGVYAYEFEGIRYDTGDKLGYLKATVEYALRDEKLKGPFLEYLKSIK
ncbi:MAG: UTP--glucose-1-phosphate uridylyltransferase [Clostridia bacterium]|nr:UTP--glucose-1-phosphate uridylyltransferase [Clostridia bacterium]